MFDFDRFAQPNLDDPYPLYQQARERAGVFYADAFDLWVVTRYDDVREVLTDSTRFSSEFLIRTPRAPAAGVTDILREGHPEVRMLLNQDPPEHTRVRSLVGRLSGRGGHGRCSHTYRRSPTGSSTASPTTATRTWSGSSPIRCRCR